jgi:hypothetical protein
MPENQEMYAEILQNLAELCKLVMLFNYRELTKRENTPCIQDVCNYYVIDRWRVLSHN